MVERMQERVEAGNPSNSPTATANTKTPEPAILLQIDPHPSIPEFSPAPTTLDSPLTLTHTAAMTGGSEYTGAFSQLNHSNLGSYPQSHQHQHYGENSDALAVLPFIERDEPNAAPKPPPLLSQESRGPILDVEAIGYNTPRDAFVHIEPSHTMAEAFTPHGPLPAGLQGHKERSAKRQEVAKETGSSLENVLTEPSSPQTGLLGGVSPYEHERRLAEDGECKFDDLQKRQLETAENGSMYGSLFGPGFHSMTANPMMMGVTPLMNQWGFGSRISDQLLAPAMFAITAGLPLRLGQEPAQRIEASSLLSPLIASTNTEMQEPALLPQTDSHPSSPEFSPIPTTLDSPTMLMATATATGEGEDSKYPGGVEPSPPQQVPGALKHSNPGSYFQSPQFQNDDENPDALATSTSLKRNEVHAVLKPPPQEGRGPTLDMGVDGYDTPSDSEDDASQDSDSHEWKYKSSFAPPRQGLAKPPAQQDGWVDSSSLGPVNTVTTSVSERGMPLAPLLPFHVEH